MALFVVVGVTNLATMVVLAAVVLAEKLWVHGELLPGWSAWPPLPWPSP
jgi:predicted metal-binding membrane protein